MEGRVVGEKVEMLPVVDAKLLISNDVTGVTGV
jgi:hypothetical protein